MTPQALRYFQEIQTVVRICGITYCHSANDPNRGHGHPRRLGWGSIHSHFVLLFFRFQLNPLSPLLLWLLPLLPSLTLRSGCIDKTLRGLDCNMGLMCAPLYLLPSEVGSVRSRSQMSELKFTNITEHYTVTGVGGGRIPSRARIGQSLPYLLLWRQSFLWEIQNNMIFISFNLFYFSGGKRKTPQGKELARALLWFRTVLLLQS